MEKEVRGERKKRGRKGVRGKEEWRKKGRGRGRKKRKLSGEMGKIKPFFMKFLDRSERIENLYLGETRMCCTIYGMCYSY